MRCAWCERAADLLADGPMALGACPAHRALDAELAAALAALPRTCAPSSEFGEAIGALVRGARDRGAFEQHGVPLDWRRVEGWTLYP